MKREMPVVLKMHKLQVVTSHKLNPEVYLQLVIWHVNIAAYHFVVYTLRCWTNMQRKFFLEQFICAHKHTACTGA